MIDDFALPGQSPESTTTMYWMRDQGPHPEDSRIGESERYVLQMILNGNAVVSLWHSLGQFYQPHVVPESTAPDWTAAETYYDVLTDILQAARHAGFDPERLCAQAIINQQGLWDDGETMAAELRGAAT